MSIPSYVDLQKIVYDETNEPLVDLQELYPDLLCDYRRKGSRVSTVLLRRAVAEKLCNVQQKLRGYNPLMQLLIVEGYRNPLYQERYYLLQFLEVQKKYPDLAFEEFIEKANQFVALPSVAGHPTGGAVDLTISYRGEEIEMGCAIADFSEEEIIPTFASKISVEAANNRRLLHELMIGEGFAPFYGEWWHFSYGDREWAVFYHHAKTLYAPLYLEDI